MRLSSLFTALLLAFAEYVCAGAPTLRGNDAAQRGGTGFACLINAPVRAAVDTNFSPLVYSVYLTPTFDDTRQPQIRLSDAGESSETLLLRFDLMENKTRNLNYRIRHCSYDWLPDDLQDADFFSGPTEGSIDNYQSSFTTLKDYTNYYQSFPDRYSHFLVSGNYTVEVYEDGQPDSVLLCRRFVVYESAVDIEASVDRPSSAFGNINRDQELTVAITPARSSFIQPQAQYFHVVAQQNRRRDLRRELPFANYSGASLQYRWQKENVFPGGNHFRAFDLSDLHARVFHVQHIERMGNDIVAFLQPDEVRSHGAYTQYNSLNGGMKTNIHNRSNPHIEADYVWVTFSLPMERPLLGGTVHIVGDLTLWALNDDSRMEWNPQYHAYTRSPLLKQGYYSYQYIYLPGGYSEGYTADIEGDHGVMSNDYTVYIYYRQPGSRYDRLVALRTLRRE